MIEYGKYVGIPFVKHGRTPEIGFDCFGLVRFILNAEFGKNIPDWRADKYENESISRKIHEELYQATKIEDPQEGDFGLFCYDGFPDHMTLYIGKGRIIHTTHRDEYSLIEKITSPRLTGRLNGWYRFD